jgi:hypothetical protein
MKSKRILAMACILSVFCMGLCSVFTPSRLKKAEAGTSAKILSNSDTLFLENNQISTTDYQLGDGLVNIVKDPEDAERNVVAFTQSSTSDSVLFLRSWPTVTELKEGIPSVEMDLEFTLQEIVEETAYKGSVAFGYAFGVQRLADGVGSKNSAFLWIKANVNENVDVLGDEYVYGLTVYNDAGVGTDLIGATVISSTNNISVQIEQYRDETLHLSINGEQSSFENIKIGYSGFGTLGYINAQNYVRAYVRQYDVVNNFSENPENPVIFMDFESKDINFDLMYAKGNLASEDGVLKFENAGKSAHLITKHKFSNFEMTFDVPYVKRLPTFNEQGVMQSSASVGFVILHGLDVSDPVRMGDYDLFSMYAGTMWTQIVADGFTSMGQPQYTRYNIGTADKMYTKSTNSTIFPLHNLWNEAYEGRVFNVRLTMKDGLYRLEVKWEDENRYQVILEHDYGYTQSGYIMLSAAWTANGTSANQWVDNLQITNLDDNPNIVQVGYSEQPFKNHGAYEWVDTRDPNDLLGASGYQAPTSDSQAFASENKFPVVQVILIGTFIIFGIVCLVVAFTKRKEDE